MYFLQSEWFISIDDFETNDYLKFKPIKSLNR